MFCQTCPTTSLRAPQTSAPLHPAITLYFKTGQAPISGLDLNPVSRITSPHSSGYAARLQQEGTVRWGQGWGLGLMIEVFREMSKRAGMVGQEHCQGTRHLSQRQQGHTRQAWLLPDPPALLQFRPVSGRVWEHKHGLGRTSIAQ